LDALLSRTEKKYWMADTCHLADHSLEIFDVRREIFAAARGP
jgi:hypothetical protein